MKNVILITTSVFLLVACKSESSNAAISPHPGPKSVYGESMDKAKKLSKDLNEHDKKTADQEKELEDE